MTYGQNSTLLSDSLQIIFYNVENLFDIYDDPFTADDEFTPSGEMYWTKTKYLRKINHIGQAILALTKFQLPAMIGLCEIENKKTLEDLIQIQLLDQAPFKIIHKNSCDSRGIDVALIYDTTRVKALFYDFMPVQFSNGDCGRAILYAKVEVMGDSLHLFVNHWPSRYTGAKNTEDKRIEVSQILISKCDSILKTNPEAKLLLMGDFNDEPTDKSIEYLVSLKHFYSNKNVFLNLMKDDVKAKGTIKYQGRWSIFDQFMVSSNLKINKFGLCVEGVEIANQTFLFEDDDRYLGRRPFRTFNGFKYLGGFSDHLPIKLTLGIKK